MNKQGRRLAAFTILIGFVTIVYQTNIKLHPNEFTDNLIQSFEQDSNWEFGSENITENQDYLFASNLEKSMVINIFYRKQGFFWYSGDILKDKYDEDLTYNEAKVLYYYLNERKKELRKRFVKEVTFSDNGNVLVLSKNAPPIVKQQVNVWVKKLVKDGHLEQIGD